MAISPRLEIRQTQQLAMTQELRQAIGLLRLSSQELQEFVEAEVGANPFLDMTTPDPITAKVANDQTVSQSVQMPELSLGLGSPIGPEEAAPEAGLRDALLGQLRLMRAEPEVIKTAVRIVEELDGDGFLRLPWRELAFAVEQPVDRCEAALRLVQSCEPTGVGARTLSECFALQLREMGEFNSKSMGILARLNTYAKFGAEAVAKEVGITEEDVEAVMMIVRTLDTKPGLSVQAEPVQMVVPDVSVGRGNLGDWTVELLSKYQPQVRLNAGYASTVAQAGDAAADYVSKHTKRANWLLRSLEQRSQTILRVAAEIVRIQAGFFSGGPSHLKPLTLKVVADALDVHESTVSRVTRGKFLLCERGTFELKYFFSKAISGSDGNGDRSALAVRDRIRQLIADEADVSPLSDDAIAGVLRGEGVNIARRTVAKYREHMRIPASYERRRRRGRSGTVLVKSAAPQR